MFKPKYQRTPKNTKKYLVDFPMYKKMMRGMLSVLVIIYKNSRLFLTTL